MLRRRVAAPKVRRTEYLPTDGVAAGSRRIDEILEEFPVGRDSQLRNVLDDEELRVQRKYPPQQLPAFPPRGVKSLT